ncbi:MAG: AsmA family protein, partial [Solirubrobacteraceae bacterium]
MTRRVLLSLTALLVLVVAAGVIAAASFDPDSLKPRIADAVQRATGRELTLGRLRLGWSLTPTLVAEDVHLANPPGFSRPDLLRIARIEARVALLPLLSRRVELRSVALAGPDLLLEQDAAGQPNWRFDRPAPAPAPAPAAESTPRSQTQFDLRRLTVANGQLAFRRGAAEPLAVSIAALAADAADANGPLVVSADLRVRDVPFTLRGTTGPASALTDTAHPWPVRLQASAPGLDLLADGTIGPGGNLRLDAKAADLASLTKLTGAPLPPLRDVQLTAHLVAAAPAEASLRLGASDLAPNIRLVGMALQAPALDQPVTLKGAAELHGKRVQLSGSLGTPAA